MDGLLKIIYGPLLETSTNVALRGSQIWRIEQVTVANYHRSQLHIYAVLAGKALAKLAANLICEDPDVLRTLDVSQ